MMGQTSLYVLSVASLCHVRDTNAEQESHLPDIGTRAVESNIIKRHWQLAIWIETELLDLERKVDNTDFSVKVKLVFRIYQVIDGILIKPTQMRFLSFPDYNTIEDAMRGIAEKDFSGELVVLPVADSYIERTL